MALYRERRRLGLCVQCGDKAAKGGARCEKHAADVRSYSTKRRKNLVREGTCVTCAIKPATQGGRCDGCRENIQAMPSYGTNVTKARRLSKGQCRTCETELEEDDIFVHCAQCRSDSAERAAEVRSEREENGKCSRCGRPMTTEQRCKCRRKRKKASPSRVPKREASPT